MTDDVFIKETAGNRGSKEINGNAYGQTGLTQLL
jgi:hypothetical protein